MEDTNDLYLVFVTPIGKNSDGLYEYEFFFSESPETVWAADWNISSPSACSNILPEPDMYKITKRLITDIPLFCVQENSCFSIQDCMDHIIALVFEDIRDYDEFPEPYRIVIQYGETYPKVEEILKGRDIAFTEEKK